MLVAGLAAAGLAASGVLGRRETSAEQRRGDVAAGDRDATAPPEATPAAPPATQPKAVATIKVGKGPDGVAVERRPGVRRQPAGAGTLSVIDPETNEVDRRAAPRRARGRTGSWPARASCGWRAPARTPSQRFQADGEIVPTAKVPVGDRPEAISLGKQLVWVANVNDNTVNRIDRASPAIVGGPIGVGSKPTGIFVGRRFVWVTNSGDDTVDPHRPVDRRRSSATRSPSAAARAA